MTLDSPRCPGCRATMSRTRVAGVLAHRCVGCGAVLLDAGAAARLGGTDASATPAEPADPDEHGYPVHVPQTDAGHAAARPRPMFAPGWAARGRERADGTGLLWGP